MFGGCELRMANMSFPLDVPFSDFVIEIAVLREDAMRCVVL
jgi:hypothetical protein